MRAVIILAAGLASVSAAAASAAPAHRHRHAHMARPYHIPRFSQGEAEAYVHTAYPYRTGLYVPWPDAYGAPYPYAYGAPYPY